MTAVLSPAIPRLLHETPTGRVAIASPELAAYAAAETRPLVFVEILPERVRYCYLTGSVVSR